MKLRQCLHHMMFKTNMNGVLIYVTFCYMVNVNKQSVAAISYYNNQLDSGRYIHKTPNDLAIVTGDNNIKISENLEDICKQHAPVCGTDSRTYKNICHLGLVKTKQSNLGLLYKGKCWKEKAMLLDITNFFVKQGEKGIAVTNWPRFMTRRQLSIDISTPQQPQTPTKPLLTSFFSSPAEVDSSFAVMTRQNQDLKNEMERQKIVLLEEQKKALLEEQRNITHEILSGFDKRLEELRASLNNGNRTQTEKRAQPFFKKSQSHERFDYGFNYNHPIPDKDEIHTMKTEIENYKKSMARLQVELEFQKLQKQKYIEEFRKELARQRADRKSLFKQLREALEKPHKDHHHHKSKPHETMLRHKLEKQKEKDEDEEKRKDRSHHQLKKDFEKKTAEFEKELDDLHALYKKNLMLKSELEKQTELKKSQFETMKLQLQKNFDTTTKNSEPVPVPVPIAIHNTHPTTTTSFWF